VATSITQAQLTPKLLTQMNPDQDYLLFAEEGAVFKYAPLDDNFDGGFVSRLKPFDPECEIWVPDGLAFLPLPLSINERIYHHLFNLCLKARNYEAAFYYATHVSQYLTRQIYIEWFGNPDHDPQLDDFPDFGQQCLQIRATLTLAGMMFDILSDLDDMIYPLRMDITSRFYKRTQPYALCRVPPPHQFVDHELAFTTNQVENFDFVNTPQSTVLTAIQQAMQELNELNNEESDDNISLQLMEDPFQLLQIPFLQFKRGTSIGDFSLVRGSSVASGVVKVDNLFSPCVFIQLFDYNDEPWITLDNHLAIQNHGQWKKLQELLQYSIEPKLCLMFAISPTNTFVTFN